jgi:hypothetical protein
MGGHPLDMAETRAVAGLLWCARWRDHEFLCPGTPDLAPRWIMWSRDATTSRGYTLQKPRPFNAALICLACASVVVTSLYEKRCEAT